jgi:hypothetical protein
MLALLELTFGPVVDAVLSDPATRASVADFGERPFQP